MVTAADDLCRQGYLELKRRTEDAFVASEHLFNNACAQQSPCPPALAGLATLSALRGTYGYGDSPITERYREAERLAADALSGDSLLPEAHAVLGFVRMCKRQWREAKISFGIAIASAGERNQPEPLAQARHWYSMYLTQQRQFSEALSTIDEVLNAGSASNAAKAQKGAVLVMSGAYGDAVQFLEGHTATNFGPIFRFLGQAYTHLGAAGTAGAYDNAETHLQNAVSLAHMSDADPDLLEDRGYLFAERSSGTDVAAAHEIIERLEITFQTDKTVANNIATIYAGLRDDPTYEKAKDWLNLARANDDADLGYLNVDPKWARARTIPSINATLIELNSPDA